MRAVADEYREWLGDLNLAKEVSLIGGEDEEVAMISLVAGLPLSSHPGGSY